MKNKIFNKQTAWMLFDFANQPFHTLVVTFIYVIYFNKFVIGNEEQGQIIIGWMQGISALMIAFFAPIISAITDQGGNRKRWMWLFSGIFVLASIGLVFDKSVNMIIVMYALAYFAGEMTLITINAYLPDFAKEGNVDMISGSAWGYGYIGGLILLIIFLVFLQPADGTDKTLLGLPALLGPKAALWSGPASALWYAIFIIPFFVVFKNEKGKKTASQATKDGLSSLWQSLKKAWVDRQLRWFFLSSLFYRDALVGIFTFGALYASNVLGWESAVLGAYGIVLNITGIIGGVGGGYLATKYGARWVVRYSIILFVILCFLFTSTSREAVMFISVEATSRLPDIVCFIVGMLIGAGAGAIQGISRGMVVPETEGKMLPGEAFGIYGMMGRATAFIAPISVSIATALTDSAQKGVWPITLLFLISLVAFRKYEKIVR